MQIDILQHKYWFNLLLGYSCFCRRRSGSLSSKQNIKTEKLKFIYVLFNILPEMETFCAFTLILIYNLDRYGTIYHTKASGPYWRSVTVYTVVLYYEVHRINVWYWYTKQFNLFDVCKDGIYNAVAYQHWFLNSTNRTRIFFSLL